jgi:hypothetical protein
MGDPNVPKRAVRGLAMDQMDRRDFAKFVIGTLSLPCLFTSELSRSEAPNEASVDKLVIPARKLVYSSEITHNDIHELEFASERVFDRVKTYHSNERLVVVNFKAAYQASYDFHSHMHSEFEDDHARTREAFDRLIPVFERLDDSTRKSETRHYFDELHEWFLALRAGIVNP